MLKEFLQLHAMNMPCEDEGYYCHEAIVDDPEGFIDLIEKLNLRIDMILMWHRVPINSASPIGYGGPLDARAPEEYYFAETDLIVHYDETATAEDYRQFVRQQKEAYPAYQLYAGFCVPRR